MPTVDLKQSAKAAQHLTEKLGKVAGVALWSAARRGVSKLQTQLIPAAVPSPVDRGNYRAGWRVEPHRSGEVIDGADIYNVEAHATIIERGARAANIKPGRAMLTALAEWAKRKGLEGAEDPKRARQLAWAIAMVMKRRGIFKEGQGFHLLEKLVTQHIPELFREELAAAMKAASK